MSFELSGQKNLFVKQIRELAELIGFETRNKYAILDEHQQPVGYAAEQQKGFLGFLARQFLGHWRSFEILIFDAARQPVIRARHPFRFFFQRLEVYSGGQEYIGAVQQRWAVFRKKFDVQDRDGHVILQVSSPFFKFWTFPFLRQGRQAAVVEKKWGGIFTEIFSDKDTFHIEFTDPALTETERRLVLAASMFIDLQYFEAKGGQVDLLGS